MASLSASSALPLHAQPASASTSSLPADSNNAPSTPKSGNNAASFQSALARSVTGSLAFYFKRPVKLFRPTRVSAWTAFSEIASAQGHKGQVNSGFLRYLAKKQGWAFLLREAVPPLIVNSIVGFTLFSTYTITESVLKYMPDGTISPYAIPFISGATAGAAQSIISSPLDNIRAILASQSAASKGRTAVKSPQWQGWRNIAVQALFPKWLSTGTPFRTAPITFFLNWWRSSWSLFTFTLLRDSIGFGVFFSIFELSRSLAKKAGKAVDRFQASVAQHTRELGIDLEELLENDMLDRGWPGRVVQALVIVSCGVFAGLGYGIVGRPFDKARSIIWLGLQDWAWERQREAKATELAQQERQALRDNAARIGSQAIGSIPKTKKLTIPHAQPLSVAHRSKHHRLTTHELRLPLPPPRPAEAPKHPLRRPSIMRSDNAHPSKAIPSAFSLLSQAYRLQGLTGMLGFSASTTSALASIMPSKSVLSRAQLTKSRVLSPNTTDNLSAGAGRNGARASGLPEILNLERLAEHPALGGSSVYDNLPPPSENIVKTAHRRARWWQLGRARGYSKDSKIGATRGPARLRSKLTVSGVFRVIPPYAVGFLVYALMSNDFSE